MTTATATRRIQFCAGHRLMNHEGKCANLHGHNYVAFFTAECEALDGVGRVIDFSVLKERLGGWIEENWDHGFIAHQADQACHDMWLAFNKHNGDETKYFGLPRNPTAENMADFLLRHVAPQVMKGTGVTVTRVVLWETENCLAEVYL